MDPSMQIHIFDIDGTLTSIDPDLIAATGYATHAYWDLLTFQFIENKQALKDEISAWRLNVAGLSNEAFITSSAEMMQLALLQTTQHISEYDIVQHAQKITQDFIKNNIVIHEAIAFLNKKAEEGHLCILSTGSYQSGAIGFLNALHEAGLISSIALDHIMVSGAIVNWEHKQLIHANVHNNKIKGLNDLLQTRFGFSLSTTPLENSHEIHVYADDPEGNDFGILSLTTPENRIVIAHEKNHNAHDRLEYSRMTWDEITKKDSLKNMLIPTWR